MMIGSFLALALVGTCVAERVADDSFLDPYQAIGLVQEEGEEDVSRRALMKQFGVDTPNIFKIGMEDNQRKLDESLVQPAGVCEPPFLSNYHGRQFKYQEVVGGRYQNNMFFDVSKDAWNCWVTLHGYYADSAKYGSKWPEPNEHEMEEGVYDEDREPWEGQTIAGKNIYKILWSYVPGIVGWEADQELPDSSYNGVVFLSSHGNLQGDVAPGGSVSASYLGKLIAVSFPHPKLIVVFACGAGQRPETAQEIADNSGAMVFITKFIVTRMGSLPMLEWKYAAKEHSIPTSWALTANGLYNNQGDQLSLGQELCLKLRMGFTSRDQQTWAQLKTESSYLNEYVMDNDPFYMTCAAPSGSGMSCSSFDVVACMNLFPCYLPANCRGSAPIAQQRACMMKRSKVQLKNKIPEAPMCLE